MYNNPHVTPCKGGFAVVEGCHTTITPIHEKSAGRESTLNQHINLPSIHNFYKFKSLIHWLICTKYSKF